MPWCAIKDLDGLVHNEATLYPVSGCSLKSQYAEWVLTHQQTGEESRKKP